MRIPSWDFLSDLLVAASNMQRVILIDASAASPQYRTLILGVAITPTHNHLAQTPETTEPRYSPESGAHSGALSDLQVSPELFYDDDQLCSCLHIRKLINNAPLLRRLTLCRCWVVDRFSRFLEFIFQLASKARVYLSSRNRLNGVS
jgi:hypothetical protein